MTTAEVRAVFSDGKYLKNLYFTLKYKKSHIFQVAVSAPNKYFKYAVLRNKVKRKIYSAIKAQERLPLIKVVFIPEPTLIKIPFSQIKNEISNIFSTL